MKAKDKKQKVEWKKLDNASKIFPATSNNKDTKVYRLAAELYSDVDPESLQKALDLTLRSFPMYRFVLRRGFFWYYFESSDIYPKVELESTSPCSPIYIRGGKNLLFRIFYYKKRISLEAFHALSDGVGAIWFLETLIFHYMKILHKEELGEEIPSFEYGASISQKMADSFWKNYTPKIQSAHLKKEENKSAYKIRGKKLDENRMRVIEGALSVEALLKLSREYGANITVFLTALLLYSIYLDMPKNKNKKPIVLSVPINLRSYFNSSTARNFFTTMNVGYDFQSSSHEFKDIVGLVSKKFKEELTEENIQLKLAKYMKLENNPVARIAPLTIKDIFMKIGNRFNDKKISSSISNIGKIKTAKEFEDYIKQFSVCISARAPKLTFCSYGDRLVLSFTSPFVETDIQREFFQFLSKKGIEIEITSNI